MECHGHGASTNASKGPTPSFAAPEALGGVTHDYAKWVRYGMIFGALYWWTEGGVITYILYGTVFFLGMLYMQQTTLLYAANHPQIPRRPDQIPPQYKMSSPAQYNLRFEDVYIKCPDGEVIHSWLILQPGEASKSAPTVMYFHGNAGNIGMRLPLYNDMCNRCKVNVMAVEYRGYGNSSGIPSEEGLRMDADAALNWLMTECESVNRKRIFLFGRSLGGAVATWLASKHASSPVFKGLILENTFSSIGELALKLFPLLKMFRFLLPVLLKNKWDSEQQIRSVTVPVLFLAGLKDAMIPISHMRALYNASSENSPSRIFKEFPEGGHNDTPIKHKEEYNQVLEEFLKKND